MTALADAFPSPKAENRKDSREESDQSQIPPLDTAPATPATVPKEQAPRSGIAGGVAKLFKDVKRALTGKEEPAPEPKRRRKSGETMASFRMTAPKILARVLDLPAEAYMAAHICDNPLDPANPYWSMQNVFDEMNLDVDGFAPNHHSPHP